jgi:putative addiction module CopG family antidote
MRPPEDILIVEIMNVAVSKPFEQIIDRLINTGRYRDPTEVVQAGLRSLEEREELVFPDGSLAHLYSAENNDFEVKTGKASSLRVEPE